MITDNLIQAINKIKTASTYSKEKSNKHGEVFTPFELIKEMVQKIPVELFKDPSKTFLDPCAGKGNFPIILIMRLFKGLEKAIPDEEERLKHIVENQIYMCEFQRESAEFISELFKFGNDYKVNLYLGDTLKMPEDFFDLSWEERREKYPDNVIMEISASCIEHKVVDTPVEAPKVISNRTKTKHEPKPSVVLVPKINKGENTFVPSVSVEDFKQSGSGLTQLFG